MFSEEQKARIALACDELERDDLQSRQVTGGLCEVISGQDCYCALGVFVKVYQEHSGSPIREQIRNGWKFYSGSGGSLPTKVAEWYGLDDGLPEVVYCGIDRTIDYLNDSKKLSLKAIAEVVRANYLV